MVTVTARGVDGRHGNISHLLKTKTKNQVLGLAILRILDHLQGDQLLPKETWVKKLGVDKLNESHGIPEK